MPGPVLDLFVFRSLNPHARVDFPPALRPSSVLVGSFHSLGGRGGEALMGRRIRRVYLFARPHGAVEFDLFDTINECVRGARLRAGFDPRDASLTIDVYDWPALRDAQSVAEVEGVLERGYKS